MRHETHKVETEESFEIILLFSEFLCLLRKESALYADEDALGGPLCQACGPGHA
jgi:hypothetical protein